MTRKSVYSFGESSPAKFEIPDKLATNYNSAMTKYLAAQRRFMQKLGRPWDPNKDPIEIGWSVREARAWKDFAAIFNAVNEKFGPFSALDMPEDFLVKNGPIELPKAFHRGAVIGAVVVMSLVPALRLVLRFARR